MTGKKGRNKEVQTGGSCRFIKKMLLCLRFYFDLFIDKIFGLYYNSRVKAIPAATNPILLQSATNLARKIRKKELKSEEIVQAFIDRIKEVNSLLNAVIDDRFEAAIKEAKVIDEQIANGTIQDVDFQEKPFIGVPFTTKETTACKGLSNTFGLLRRKGRKALFDAEIIENMKKSGAILIAVTNVPQLNLWQETSNPVYGITNNPYNITRNVGGSSGGEASIIAACGSPFGIGTDIGGSIRIPCFMCGLFGHKPSANLTSTNGLTFRMGNESDTMVVAGPIVKYTEDLIPMLKVLIADKTSMLKLDEHINLAHLNIFYITNPKDPFISPFREEMVKIFMKVVDYFEDKQGDKPTMLDIDGFKYGGKIWSYWMTQEPGCNFNRDIANRETEINSIIELGKFCLGQSEFNIAVMLNLINGLLPKLNATWAKEQTNILRSKLISLLGTDGVLLYPSAPWPASYHHTAILRPWNLNLFSIWNFLKFPVTQVPLGLGAEGLPLGIQVVAAPYQDHLCIAVAKELERAFGGYVPPFHK